MHGIPDDAATRRFVWDTSALLNIKEPNAQGYSLMTPVASTAIAEALKR